MLALLQQAGCKQNHSHLLIWRLLGFAEEHSEGLVNGHFPSGTVQLVSSFSDLLVQGSIQV
jgi:hypothetical protein